MLTEQINRRLVQGDNVRILGKTLPFFHGTDRNFHLVFTGWKKTPDIPLPDRIAGTKLALLSRFRREFPVISPDQVCLCSHEALLDENGATLALPAQTFLVTGEKKHLTKIVLPDGEWCREFTVCQTFGDVRQTLKEAAVILNKRFWFTINKVSFATGFSLRGGSSRSQRGP
jgi:hypothetical protein